MTSIAELIEHTQMGIGGTGNVQLHVRTGDPPAETIVQHLASYFGRDGSSGAVALVVDDDFVGYLTPDNLEPLVVVDAPVGSRAKGIADADGAFVPGDTGNWTLFEFRCTEQGCDSVALSLRYSEDELPVCWRHNVSMRIVA